MRGNISSTIPMINGRSFVPFSQNILFTSEYIPPNHSLNGGVHSQSISSGILPFISCSSIQKFYKQALYLIKTPLKRITQSLFQKFALKTLLKALQKRLKLNFAQICYNTVDLLSKFFV